ncbi:uncharacterized protein LOC119736208 [Patiria miniata]|uniref:Uncharacterized protein n=1 Tax=Patiria miniata TaxID=46514 RepID=A0A914ARU2_PATMI|nr:uncharacterized protein LOC119736208 [Patiria miniata]
MPDAPYTKLEPFTYGNGKLTVDRYQRLTPSSDYTVSFTQNCEVTNAWKVQTWEDGYVLAYMRIYGNFRDVSSSSEFDDLFRRPDICPEDLPEVFGRSGDTVQNEEKIKQLLYEADQFLP